ncbi:MAG: MFS transporter [Brevibacterium aurantiacum]|uniref:MFS transporter n=1 Tax=Brevibacterium aurantiacum TaxID=273384 RepID=A0A3Q9NY12_BREAU|nr:MFS transporter [Brevibacterium aurantiacum]AZT97646.1 MFS transporter [Brevibacterium aurantiacum]
MIRKVWPLVVAAVSLGIDAYVLAGVLPQIAESLATTVGGIGLGVTAFTGAYAVAGTTLSKRAGARSTKAGLLISLGVFNVANLITALSPNLGVFLGSRVLAGAGAGVLTALATAAAASLVSSDQRGRAMALVTFGLSTGTVAGVPIGMLIGEQIGWRWTMGLVVAVGVVSMAALAFRGGSMPPIPNEPGSGAAVLKSPQVAFGVALAFVFGVTSLGLYTYMLPMAEDRGLGAWGFALIWVWGIGGVAGSMFIGRPIDAFGTNRLLPILAAALLASFVVITFLPQPAAWLIAVLVWGATGWASVPTVQVALTSTRPAATTSIVAFQMAAMYLGSAVGSALGTALLGSGTTAGSLPMWAAGAQILAVVLAIAVGVLGRKAVRASAAVDSR